MREAKPRHRRRSRRAYTLLEVLLVMALLVAIGGMAAPMFTRYLDSHRLRAAGEDVRNAWLKCRVRAIESSRTYAFRFQPSGRAYMVQPWSAGDDYLESSDALTGNPLNPMNPMAGGGAMMGATMGATTDLTAEAETKELPEDTFFVSGETAFDARAAVLSDGTNMSAGTTLGAIAPLSTGDAGTTVGADEWSCPIFFYPDGSTSTARLTLANERERFVVVSIRGLTGIVEVSGLLTAEELP